VSLHGTFTNRPFLIFSGNPAPPGSGLRHIALGMTSDGLSSTQFDSLPATMLELMTKARTFFALALSVFLGTVLLSYIAAQQLDAKNWGKNSPGITLALREGPRQKAAQGTLLLYNVLGRGFPSGIPYELWQWRAGQEPKKIMQGVSFDEHGVMVCSGRGVRDI
jgi:hypothetical protein